MAGEDKQGEEKDFEVQKDEKGNFPENIPSSKYIGVKEALGRAKEKNASLEEQLSKRPTQEAYEELQKKYDEANAKVKTADEEKAKATEKTVTELKEGLKKSGVYTDEELEKMSETELSTAAKVVARMGGKPKPLPDLGDGGQGGSVPKGSPMQLAREAYANSSKK